MSYFKHVLHCLLMMFTISCFVFTALAIRADLENLNPEYNQIFKTFLVSVKYLVIFGLPPMLTTFLGLLIFNTFPDKVTLKGSPLLAPFISFRVVTRGDYPELVKENVLRHVNTCFNVGVEDFIVEVVTDKPINVPKHRRIREIVVPKEYKTSTGALYKSRALQYCLEDDVNVLNPKDWIVHLDEETLMTENCLRGIINFVIDGKFPFGQGLITYAHENVVNWLTTLSDCRRVSSDMGMYRFQFKTFHKPLLGWKGSYVVAQFYAEHDVSFDNGPDGSIAEDCFFALKASSKGYSFDWIEGEMHERSPFTINDFLQQRKRWLQGCLLVVHSKAIPLKHKLLLVFSTYSWCCVPLMLSNFFFAIFYPTSSPIAVDFLCAFMGGISIYTCIFGALKSFSLYRCGIFKTFLAVIGSISTIPFTLMIESVVAVVSLTSNKHRFYVVDKKLPNTKQEKISEIV